jgi:hypothetical protein
MIFKEMGGSNMSAAAVNFQWQGSNTPSTILMQLQGGGNLALPRTNAAQAQVLLAGAPGDANMVGGAFQVGTGGMYEDGHFCSVSMSNASPSLSSSPATDFNCFVTAAAGSAIAVNYQITFPTEASTRTNAPSCYINYQAGAAQTSVPTCTVSTANPMVATVIFGVAPTTTGRFNILLMANGP